MEKIKVFLFKQFSTFLQVQKLYLVLYLSLENLYYQVKKVLERYSYFKIQLVRDFVFLIQIDLLNLIKQ